MRIREVRKCQQFLIISIYFDLICRNKLNTRVAKFIVPLWNYILIWFIYFILIYRKKAWNAIINYCKHGYHFTDLIWHIIKSQVEKRYFCVTFLPVTTLWIWSQYTFWCIYRSHDPDYPSNITLLFLLLRYIHLLITWSSVMCSGVNFRVCKNNRLVSWR